MIPLTRAFHAKSFSLWGHDAAYATWMHRPYPSGLAIGFIAAGSQCRTLICKPASRWAHLCLPYTPSDCGVCRVVRLSSDRQNDAKFPPVFRLDTFYDFYDSSWWKSYIICNLPNVECREILALLKIRKVFQLFWGIFEGEKRLSFFSNNFPTNLDSDFDCW